jgi:hypothetical protein
MILCDESHIREMFSPTLYRVWPVPRGLHGYRDLLYSQKDISRGIASFQIFFHFRPFPATGSKCEAWI